MNSFCAVNSFRMSFWSVPRSLEKGTPCFSATARYMAHSTAAGPLIVIDVLTSPSGIPSSTISMSASDDTPTPQRPNSPTESGWSVS